MSSPRAALPRDHILERTGSASLHVLASAELGESGIGYGPRLHRAVVQRSAPRARLTRRALEPRLQLGHAALECLDLLRCTFDLLPAIPALEGF